VLLLAVLVLALAKTGGVIDEAPRPMAPGAYEAIDGDSLRRAGREYRLNGIDAPELHQSCQAPDGSFYACGREARDVLAGLIRGRALVCVVLDSDRYGRAVARCRAGEADLNADMVRRGWALAYRRHSNDYVDEEAAARKGRLGIWRGRFETPEAWRKSHPRSTRRGALDAASVPDED
jgi:endonuclease YncB( thermonuclease family)